VQLTLAIKIKMLQFDSIIVKTTVHTIALLLVLPALLTYQTEISSLTTTPQ